MKPLFISFLFTVSLSGGLMYFSHAKTEVKYTQIFAEKKITLAEIMTYPEMLNLKRKKGFLNYE